MKWNMMTLRRELNILTYYRNPKWPLRCLRCKIKISISVDKTLRESLIIFV